MEVRIMSGSFVDKGNAIRIQHMFDGRVIVTPEYNEEFRFKIIILDATAAALVAVKEGKATWNDMLEFKPIYDMPNTIPSEVKRWMSNDDHQCEFFMRIRALTQAEVNEGILGIYYTNMVDGAYDERVSRARQKSGHLVRMV